MATCPNCGQDNPDGFRFCGACGATLEAKPLPDLVRKTVTLVFSDIAGSTALGEGRDPESIRMAMDRYFAEMRVVLERHGGLVEKFVGDAVMAAFGIPVVHEDDPLRAVRAALEMRGRLTELNHDLERDWGVRLNARIGVNTGEVVAGDPSDRQTFATGDTVNTAARLEQAAPHGEILLGDSTYRLVRDAVQVEAVEPLSLKGKAEPVPAYRLIEVAPTAAGRARRMDLPLVGRTHELGLLATAFEEVLGTGSCRLVTVTGEAGAGKSRLVEELAESVRGRGRVLRGRCLTYGQGITFWPVAEVVRSASGIVDDDSLEAAVQKLQTIVGSGEEESLVAQGVASALGLAEASVPMEQLLWAIRRFLERLAGDRPLVVVLDDLQWGEAALLDLVEHVATLASASLLLLCMARPEFWEMRPHWGEGTAQPLAVRLEPLQENAGDALLASVLAGASVDPRVAKRVIRTAGGNPLFLQELVAMLIDEGHLRSENGRWVAAAGLDDITMPSSVESLLGARIEGLPGEERVVLETASVVGEVFYPAAVGEMAPPTVAERLDKHLEQLDRRELVHPSDETLAEQPALRFRHLLIRDAAYGRLSKGLRARLHRSLAAWLERIAGQRFPGFEEIVGYHLEQSVRYRAEIAPVTDEDRALARRAAELLASAARRALSQGDASATAGLLSRATALVPEDDPWRLRLLPDLGRALNETGRIRKAKEILKDALQRARDSFDAGVEATASLSLSMIEHYYASATWIEEAERRIDRAIPILKDSGDFAGLALAFELKGKTVAERGRIGDCRPWFQRAAQSAERAGDPAGAARCLSHLTGAALLGPLPVPEGISECQAVLPRLRAFRSAEANALANLGALRGYAADVEAARQLIPEAAAILADLGVTAGEMGATALRAQRLGRVELLVGDLESAERELMAARDDLISRGEVFLLTTVDADLANALFDLGRYGEAKVFAESARDHCPHEDLLGQAGWRTALARVWAQQGQFEEAEILAREAVHVVSDTDFVLEQAMANRALAEVLAGAGRRKDAVAAAREALELFRRKGIVETARPVQQLKGLGHLGRRSPRDDP
jgi:class 3 adenylate cyclase/tetratricopeptide (TPR) repeat protein